MYHFISFFALFLTCFSYLLFTSQNTKVTTPPVEAISNYQITIDSQEKNPNQEIEEVFLDVKDDVSFYGDPEGTFELPLEGATGFASMTLNLRELPTTESAQLGTISAGTGFRIIKEEGDWWFVAVSEEEGYRPYEVQVKIREELLAASQVDSQIKAGISTAPWSTTWFISTGISNHQRGYAVDVSLATILETEVLQVGDYLMENIVEYQEAVMPTPIHELSSFSKSMAYPVNSNNDIDWRTAILSETMNEKALLLREYCTKSGFTPLASEWWHFNDLDYSGKINCTGDFFLTELFSQPPVLAKG